MSRKPSNIVPQEKVDLYKKLLATHPEIEMKGANMLYTSQNGHMFSTFNKQGQFGLRLSKEHQQEFMDTYDTTVFKSYGAVMRGYVLVPDRLLESTAGLAPWLAKSYDYILSLEPK